MQPNPNVKPALRLCFTPVLILNQNQYFVTRADCKQNLGNGTNVCWAETKQVYARTKEESSDSFEHFTKIPYAAIFMIKMEVKNGAMMLADNVGVGKVYAPFEYPSRTFA